MSFRVRNRFVPAVQATLGLRSVAALVLVLFEVFALSVRFDTGALAGVEGWWAEVLYQGSTLLRLGMTVAVAAALFCGPAIRDELRTLPDSLPISSGRLALFLLGHLLAITCLYQLTAVLLERSEFASNWGTGCFIAWLASAVLAAATLGLTLFPATVWTRLARQTWVSLIVALAVGIVAWGGGLISGHLWEPLGRSTLWLVRLQMGLAGEELVYSPANFHIGTPRFVVEIATQCSGYEGIGLILAFLGGYLWLCRHTLLFPHAFLLLPVGMVVVWAVNATRITALILIGTWWSRGVAAGGFHSQAGWLAFNAIALGLVVLTHRSRLCRRATSIAPTTPANKPSPVAAYLLPLLVLVSISMMTAAFMAGFDILYPVRVIGVAAVLYAFRNNYRSFRWSWEAVGIGLIAFAIWFPLAAPAERQEIPAEVAALPTTFAALWIGFRIVGSCLTVPLAEELAFRGYLLRRLIGPRFERVSPRQFTWLSCLVSSALFGAMHGQWLAGMLAGLLYALAVYRRGRLGDAVLAHATTNVAIAAYVLVTGDWSLWL